MFYFKSTTVYYLLEAGLSLCLATIFTVMAVYRVQTVGLNPLQLVLLGTMLEAACFVLEVPTGIVADVVSRRLSVIIGVFVMGLGAIIEGNVPLFGALLAAQVVWALGYTFISGATQAWITDEVGEAAVEQVFLRAVQMGQAGSLVGIVGGVALASWQINLPMLVGGGLLITLAGFLALTMTEHGFTPAPREQRTTWGQMGATFRDGLQAVRGRPLLLSLLGISAITGMASEGFDRLWQNHLLVNFTFPSIGNFAPILWFGIIGIVGTLISMVVVGSVSRWLRPRSAETSVRVLFWLYVLLAGSVVVFGVAQQFGLALLAYWTASTLRGASNPLYAAWLNRNIDSPVRATVLSMSSQCDAFGQIAGGPIIGVVATRISLRLALVIAGISLTPVLLLFRRKQTPENVAPEPSIMP